jgi:hypothetical protein
VPETRLEDADYAALLKQLRDALGA